MQIICAINASLLRDAFMVTSSDNCLKGCGMNEKKALREAMLKRRTGLAPAEAAAASAAVIARVRELAVWREAREVLFYLPVKNEIDPRGLLQELWERKARTLLPRCRENQPGMLDLACVGSLEETCPGSYGIAEPHIHLCRAPETFSPDLILIPGAAFDRRGFRIGFGGGYYDRLLASAPMNQAATIGLAYDFQIADRLPVDPWDKRVRIVCTDKETIWTTR